MTTPAPSPTLPTSDTVSLTLEDLEQLCRDAVRAAGGSAQTAVSLASATVAAERRGRAEVGAAHLLDYLDAMVHGRLDGGAFSLDAPPFDAGEEQPGVGLFAIAIDPGAFDPAYAERVESHLRGIAWEYGADFGRRKASRTHVDLPTAVHAALAEAVRGGAPS